MMAQGAIQIEPFKPAAGDACAAEHAAVSAFVEEAVTAGDPRQFRMLDLKSLPSGQALLDAKPEQARRIAMAAIQQARHWDEQVKRVRAQGNAEIDRMNAYMLPGWYEVWPRRQQAGAVAAAIMRRTLPLEEEDLLAILEWGVAAEHVFAYFIPLSSITRALQRFTADHAISARLHDALHRFAQRLRNTPESDARRYAVAIEALFVAPQETAEEASTPPSDLKPPPQRSPAGSRFVLHTLKAYVGVGEADDGTAQTREMGYDCFPLRSDSPLAAEHELISELFPELTGTRHYRSPDLPGTAAGRKMLGLDEAAHGRLLLAAAERDINSLLGGVDFSDPLVWQCRSVASELVPQIARLPFTIDRDGAFDLLLYVGVRGVAIGNRTGFADAISRLLEQVASAAQSAPFTEGERFVLHMLRASQISGPPLGIVPLEVTRLTKLIGDGALFYLVPGEAWTDQLNSDIAQMPPDRREAWVALLKHTLTATGSRPSGKWTKQAAKLAAAVDENALTENLLRWFPLVSRGRALKRLGAYAHDARGGADTMQEENAIAMRGLLWLVPTLQRKSALVRDVGAVALSGYRKVPGVGPRAVKVGNGAVYALSEIATPQAVGQLAMLKVRVKFGSAQKEIEKAFDAAASALGLPRDQIEEMGVPSYGLEEVGLRREQFGDGITAELRVDGRDVSLAWLRADGKPQKSVPASVKSNHKEELKELQAAAKDIAAMLPAQNERIDQAFLQQKRWNISAWRERYLDHPLVGTIAHRLIWTFTQDGDHKTGIWHNGALVNVDDEAIDLAPESTVELSHPIGRPMDDILAWRTWLERHEVRQPFKQAHRELYILTDAERRTGTYSNRFAAHILRQHQFHALCAARGWRNKLRLMVDDAYPPATRELPGWGLRAEFWIEGIGDNYGQDTNDSGTYLRLASDQVRFYRSGAAANSAHAGGGGYTTHAGGPGTDNINEPLPLDQIPPLVFSEILRDVDLFVGVASIGNDPTWQDGGPEGRYRTYWHNYSFGDLSETAQTRRAVLERLIPRLTKIRDRCSLSDRFLVVRGELRTYKIHLGSGNILMEPNDQYLCIVPSRTPTDGSANVFLPFEGDATLSIILSKAFLLADDRKIKDPTITRQITER
ncbi:MAG TPA: DUF4132 domain-containing protein [Humisphaera sp.]|jgi:hypothetical protein|nr:DUF4132 domain-containing protein [Humisphaera sp.]